MRILGIDDAPFTFSDSTVPIVGALLRSPAYLEAVMTSKVSVDGTDSTAAIIEMVRGSRYSDQVKLVLLDGIAFGGFNLVDIDAVHDSLRVPVATVTRDAPDMIGLKGALQKHFDDWQCRWELLERHPVVKIDTDHNPIYVSFVGIRSDDLKGILRSCTIQGAIPEPLRVAHIIASAFVKGESYGRA
ncbi:MAG: hypothetical protein A4E32_02187 [Methanomassiliicoccales archaeon PtaU1.Bin124]|nr:MAG: hypothetical protein A4E32_02187 [Methanomassiliicoccales archaeon PtaU1.Bin124]